MTSKARSGQAPTSGPFALLKGKRETVRSGSEKRIRQHIQRVRLSDEERAALVRHAAEAGVDPTVYLRNIALSGGTARRGRQRHRDEMVTALSRIGNNLNQLARRSNLHGSLIDTDEAHLAELVAELRELIEAL